MGRAKCENGAVLMTEKYKFSNSFIRFVVNCVADHNVAFQLRRSSQDVENQTYLIHAQMTLMSRFL